MNAFDNLPSGLRFVSFALTALTAMILFIRVNESIKGKNWAAHLAGFALVFTFA